MQSELTRELRANGLDVDVAGRHLVRALDVAFEPGEIVAVLGKNGAGKSLLLHSLAGLRDTRPGSVTLGGVAIADMPRRAFALALALLPQDSDDVFPSSVLETALIGRHPHVGRFGWESREDLAIARGALATMGLADMADRDVLTLSGGERQRLAIAQVLAQDTDVLLLDEPTNHLDPQHQLEALDLFRSLAARGKCIVIALHDINYAARYADRCLLLYGDGRWTAGDARDVLDCDRLEALYETPIDAVSWRDRTLFVPGVRPPNP